MRGLGSQRLPDAAGGRWGKRGSVIPTIRDVARRAGVSVGTVSAVLNASARVSDGTRARVRAAISEMGYRPNLVARALNTKRTRCLAFLVPSISNPFFSSVLRAVERTAHRSGYIVFVGNSEGDPSNVGSYKERLLDMQVDGVLTVLSWDLVSGDLIPTLGAHGIPVVGVAGSRTVDGIDCFVSDDVAAGEIAGKYLLGLGHHAIAFLGATDSHTTELRYQGLCRVLERAGATPDPSLMVRVPGYEEEDAARAVEELIMRNASFSAVIAFNDVVALGALNALEDHGFSVPGRISLVGFDDTVSAYSRPKLTTVACPKEQLGEQGVRRVLERIAGRVPEAATVHRLPVRLVARASTRARSDHSSLT